MCALKLQSEIEDCPLDEIDYRWDGTLHDRRFDAADLFLFSYPVFSIHVIGIIFGNNSSITGEFKPILLSSAKVLRYNLII